MSLSISAISVETWPAFVSLMGSDKQCAECWCLNHRAPAGCAVGVAAQSEMRDLVGKGSVHGLLAFRASLPRSEGSHSDGAARAYVASDECVGWIAVDPMESLVGHDCQASGKSGEWAIHCLYVKAGFRGQGISRARIEAAVGYAREHGAGVVSAFPIPSQNRARFSEGEAEFSGRLSTYLKLGFREIGMPSRFYQRVEL